MEKQQITPNKSNALVDENGKVYKSFNILGKALGVSHTTISNHLKRYGAFRKDGMTYSLIGTDGNQIKVETKDFVAPKESVPPKASDNRIKILDDNKINAKLLQDLLDRKNIEEAVSEQPFVHTNINFEKKEKGHRYAVTLFSDAHIEETVLPATVLWKNEYNLDIARQRIKNYFVNLVDCLIKDEVDDLLFASLGDTITSYLHDENISENQCTPLEAVYIAQNLIFDGLKYICDHTQLSSIQFIGIVGNHSRTTKKIQHSNGYKMAYEWLMYKNIQKECELNGLPIKFHIPESEMFLADMPDKRRLLFMHGFQIKGGGTNTVCGIYPALNRLHLKLSNTFHQDHIFLGHFHSLTSIPHATVNGSIISWNTFAMTNGMPYEEPMQAYVVFDSVVGELLSRKIYCK